MTVNHLKNNGVGAGLRISTKTDRERSGPAAMEAANRIFDCHGAPILSTRREDLSYYAQAIRHAIDLALSEHPDWNYPLNPERVIEKIKRDYRPFPFKSCHPSYDAWRDALKELKDVLADNREKWEAEQKIKEEAKMSKVKKFMEEKGITVAQAAMESGVSPATIVKWRKGIPDNVRSGGRKLLDYLNEKGFHPAESKTDAEPSSPCPAEETREPEGLMWSPEDIRTFMDRKKISIDQAVSGAGVSHYTVSIYRQTTPSRVTPEGKRFISWLENMGLSSETLVVRPGTEIIGGSSFKVQTTRGVRTPISAADILVPNVPVFSPEEDFSSGDQDLTDMMRVIRDMVIFIHTRVDDLPTKERRMVLGLLKVAIEDRD